MTGTKTAIQICLLSMRDFCEEQTSNLAAEGLVHIRLLIRPDNEALFEGALLMLQLLSSPGKKEEENPATAADGSTRQWLFNHNSLAVHLSSWHNTHTEVSVLLRTNASQSK